MSSGAYPKSSAEWERRRADISTLYLTEDRPLKEVQQIMEAQFGFKATRMYTRRINKWNLHKHYKAQEKDMLAERIAKAYLEGESPSNMTFKGRPIKFHRVLRCCRLKSRKIHPYSQKAQFRSSRTQSPRYPIIEASEGSTMSPGCSDISSGQDTPVSPSTPSSVQDASSDVIPAGGLHSRQATGGGWADTKRNTPTLSSLILSRVGGATPQEIILLATDSYVKSLLEANDPTTPPLYLSEHKETFNDIRIPLAQETCPEKSKKFWRDLKTALYLLKVGSLTMGWAVLHATCESAAEIVASQPLAFLRITFTTLSPGNVWKFPALRNSLLNFLAAMLQIKLGVAHPTVQICQQLQRDEESQKTSEAALRLMGNSFEKSLGHHHDETFQNYRALIICQRRNDDLTAAENSALALVERLESSSGGAGQLVLALSELSHVLKEQMRYEEAISLCVRILQNEKQDSDAPPEKLSIYTREDIAELHRLQGNLLVESSYLSEALPISLRLFGHEATSVHILDKLRVSLMSQGRAPDALRWDRSYLERSI